MSELDATIRYLRERHAAVSANVDRYTSPGHGAPGFVDQLQRDLRGLEDAMVKLVVVDTERVAQLLAHRACCGTEHDPENGKFHGYCVVCGVPWPCEYAESARRNNK